MLHNKTVTKNIIYMCLWFGFWFMTVLVVRPKLATISYFGNFTTTILQYMLAFVGASYFMWRAGNAMKKYTNVPKTGFAIQAIAVLMGVIAFLPYALNSTVFTLHMTIAGSMLLIVLGVSIRLLLLLRSWFALCMILLQSIATVLLIYTFPLTDASILWRLQIFYEITIVLCFVGVVYATGKKYQKQDDIY